MKLVRKVIMIFLPLAIRIGFEQQSYTFTEPPDLELFNIPLVKEGGQLSEQTFIVQLQVSNMTNPFQPASFSEDYDHQIFNITFLPDQQTISWEFQLIPNEAPEENEAFRVILSSALGFPNFLGDGDDIVNETLIVIHDPQSRFSHVVINTVACMFIIIGLVGFIQDNYIVREDDSFINISIFSYNSSLDVMVNFTTVDHTALEGIDEIK